MNWPSPLIEATLIKRYKRFFADTEINGDILTAHLPNTGSMKSCWEAGWRCALSYSNNPSRKLTHTLELTHNGKSWIGVNTSLANKMAYTFIKNNLIPSLSGYSSIEREKKIGNSRLDLFLSGHTTLPSCYVEVKNVTLKLDEIAQFPDAITERGQKHLVELMKNKENGMRSVMLYIVAREDVELMKPAKSIDPKYASLVEKAHQLGVEFIAVQCKIDLTGISFKKELPFLLE